MPRVSNLLCVREVREAYGLSAEKAAELAGISTRTMYRYEEPNAVPERLEPILRLDMSLGGTLMPRVIVEYQKKKSAACELGG